MLPSIKPSLMLFRYDVTMWRLLRGLIDEMCCFFEILYQPLLCLFGAMGEDDSHSEGLAVVLGIDPFYAP